MRSNHASLSPCTTAPADAYVFSSLKRMVSDIIGGMKRPNSTAPRGPHNVKVVQVLPVTAAAANLEKSISRQSATVTKSALSYGQTTSVTTGLDNQSEESPPGTTPSAKYVESKVRVAATLSTEDAMAMLKGSLGECLAIIATACVSVRHSNAVLGYSSA